MKFLKPKFFESYKNLFETYILQHTNEAHQKGIKSLEQNQIFKPQYLQN